MGQINVSLPSDGETADVADYNTPITTIVDEINGNLDNSNIDAAAAISGSKLADSSVTADKLALGAPVQTVSVSYTTVSTTTTTIPVDDTIPQNTEGAEFMTLSITPKSATNILVIEGLTLLSHNSAASSLVAALFKDSTTDALAAGIMYQHQSTGMTVVPTVHTMVSGTTSAIAFKIRGGSGTAGTVTFNGAASARYFGAITKSVIKITEYRAS